MAEAIFNHLAKEGGLSARATSAGTIPAEEADPRVAKILNKHNIEYAEHIPQKLNNEMLEEAEYIISFGCLIPDMFPEEKFEEWLVEDPHTPEEYESAFRTIQQHVVVLQERLYRQG